MTTTDTRATDRFCRMIEAMCGIEEIEEAHITYVDDEFLYHLYGPPSEAYWDGRIDPLADENWEPPF